MPAKKLDIFELLGEIDKQNIDFYDNLEEDRKKGFAPIVAVKWFTGINLKTRIKMVNALLNPLIFSLYQHPSLLYKLMVVCSDGHKRRYKWIKGKSAPKHNKSIAVIREYYKCSQRDALSYLSLLDVDDIIEMAKHIGEEPKVIKEIKKEHK